MLKKHQIVMKEQLFEAECSLMCNFTLQQKERIKQEILGIASVKLTSLGVY
jgi:hypothetical protein